jgi:hypothetical protein
VRDERRDDQHRPNELRGEQPHTGPTE